jgi:hypothetical protein
MALLAPVATLGGLALALSLGRIVFWLRYWARRNDCQRAEILRGTLDRLPTSCDRLGEIEWANRSSPDRARILACGLISESGRRVLLVDAVASLAALAGLGSSFVALRVGAVQALWLPRALSPALAGLAVFVFARTVLAVFRAWGDALRDDVAFALQRSAPLPQAPVPASPIETAPVVRVELLSSPVPNAPGAASPRRRIRRPRLRPAGEDAAFTIRGMVVFTTCLLGSIAFHSAIFLIAQRLDSAAVTAKRAEGDGIIFARLVPPRKEAVVAPPPVDVKPEPLVLPEAPPPPPPPAALPPPPDPPPPPVPPPLPQEVAAPPPPKPEPPPKALVTEEVPQTPVVKDTPPQAPPPSPPPAVPEPRETATAPEPPAPAAPKPRETPPPSPLPPAVRYTESPKSVAKEPEAAPLGPPPPARELPATSTPASHPDAIGYGAKSEEKSPSPKASDAGAAPGEISTVRDYRRFLSSDMKGGAKEGQYVPNLRFGDNKAQENREIMRYFGMELIAYPRNQKFYVYIDPEQGLYSRSNDFSYIHNFSTRVIFRNSPYFDSLRAEAARKAGVGADSLVVAQLLKPSAASYIGWKEGECARGAGVALEDVEACDASFVKTPFGVWIVRIDRLLLKDGRTLPVQDFEWAKMSAGKGVGP